MRCCGKEIGKAFFAMLCGVAMLSLVNSRPAGAANDSPWAWGAQLAMVSPLRSDPFGLTSYGIQGGILHRASKIGWLGLEAGFYDHAQEPYLEEAQDTRPYPLQGPIYSSHLALAGQIGPAWAYRPYLCAAAGMERLTDERLQGGYHESSGVVEFGAGMRGGNRLLPWLEWRWHHGLRNSPLMGAPLDYHTLGIGLGWN